MLRIVNNLGLLYTDQGKLVEAEQMYQRALQGYEKILGADSVITYIPALNTFCGFGSLFQRQADFAKAKIMNSKALIGYEKVVGPNDRRCQNLREILQDLDIETKTTSIKGKRELKNNLLEAVSGLDSKGASLTSRRYRLFKKLGLR
jgi:tetratricopeptide (TPR) repeat protein